MRELIEGPVGFIAVSLLMGILGAVLTAREEPYVWFGVPILLLGILGCLIGTMVQAQRDEEKLKEQLG